MDTHCKVRYGEEYRRFVVKSANFNELFEIIRRLFNLPDGCALKYKDDEGDLVTMSSDEELLSALEFSPNLLHLIVANPSQPQEIFPENFGNFHFGGPHHVPPHVWGRKGCKRGKKWEKKCHKKEKKCHKMEKKCHKMRKCALRNPEKLQKRIHWLTKKRDEFQRRANEIQAILVQEGPLSENLVHEQQMIEKKLLGISARLERMSLMNTELSSSSDLEQLPDVVAPKVDLTDEERQKYLNEITEIRENLFKSCFFATKESKLKMKFCRSVLDNFSGNPESEEGKSLVHEWESARSSFKENRKVLKSVMKREEELCDLLGMERHCRKLFWKERCQGKKQKHCSKKFKK